MKTKTPWYIGQRAESLAIVYLTRRDDLKASKQTAGQGLDFLVTITKDGINSGRLFGVEVKATVSNSELIAHDETWSLKNHSYLKIRSLIDLPFPVCLFFFTLDNDQGYYKWVLEPIFQAENHDNLRLNIDNKFKKLNDQEIANIVASVNYWYDNKHKLMS
ncbi:hypothetical protein Nos7524_2051 [Nostoc sp. PCC 7524]|uniref:DUF4365 domain-containing protein n=1 Tax=Nostoc sp. (strain ATCC 29411 / PCC 7524) TaxID=28072 RepID=UPI00029F3B45|nr:DUF4365 domain-containing protein [Nostoc sp. PCC 7524]AFY47904.1 hypothetical protein Nos7524_2051 [Nostoc sp. PCC 7524]